MTYILAGARTPFGKFSGSLKNVPAVELGGIAIKAAVERSGVSKEHIDEVIMGMVLQGGAGQIPSRQASRLAGLPWEVATETINKVCASGLRSITLADQIIRAGDANLIVAGGMESMNSAPYLLKSARFGMRMGNNEVTDSLLNDGLWCSFHDVHMISHANNTALEHGITRQMQDEWALRSHKLAAKAIDSGYFEVEIVPVTLSSKRGQVSIDTDEAVRRDTTLEQLSSLRPIYGATITAGNAPGINDGAAALVLASEGTLMNLGNTPLAKILGHTSIGIEAKDFAMTPSVAIKKLLDKNKLTVSDIDLFEVNEAFAAVVLSNGKVLGWDENKVNIYGGAVALGHPIGASGTRIVLTLIHQLKRQGGGLGVAAICSGAAQGEALLIQVD